MDQIDWKDMTERRELVGAIDALLAGKTGTHGDRFAVESPTFAKYILKIDGVSVAEKMSLIKSINVDFPAFQRLKLLSELTVLIAVTNNRGVELRIPGRLHIIKTNERDENDE